MFARSPKSGVYAVLEAESDSECDDLLPASPSASSRTRDRALLSAPSASRFGCTAFAAALLVLALLAAAAVLLAPSALPAVAPHLHQMRMFVADSVALAARGGAASVRPSSGRVRVPVTACSLGYQFYMWPAPSIYNYQLWLAINDTHPNWPILNGLRQTVFVPQHREGQFSAEMIIPLTLQQHPCRTMDPEQATFFVWPMYLYFMRLLEVSKHDPTNTAALNAFSRTLRDGSKDGANDLFFQFMDEQHALDQQRLQTLVAQFPAKELAARDGSLILSADDMAVMFPDRPRISESAPIPIQFPALGSPLPSTLKQYWTRFNTCDQVIVAGAPFDRWDPERAWSDPRAPYGRPIYLALELVNVNDYRNNWDLAKNIGFPYVLNPSTIHDHSQYLLCRQLQLAAQQSGLEIHALLDIGVDRCMPATPQEQELFDRYLRIRASARGLSTANASITADDLLPRQLLSYFLGSPSHAPRQRLLAGVNAQRDAGHLDVVFDNLEARVAGRAGIDTDAMFGYFNSKFCFVLKGDTPSSKRLYDMLAAGCIPVIAEDNWVLPLPSLPWHDMALRFPFSLVDKDPQLIFDTLRSIPPERVIYMQSVILKHRHLLFYPLVEESFRPHHDDVVDVMLRELALRKHYATSCKYPPQSGTF